MEDSKERKIAALLSGDVGRIIAALDGNVADIPVYHTEDGSGLYFASDGSQVSRYTVDRSSGIHASGNTYINAVVIHYAPGTNVLAVLKQHG